MHNIDPDHEVLPYPPAADAPWAGRRWLLLVIVYAVAGLIWWTILRIK